MTHSLRQLLSELERFGIENDGTTTDRSRRMLNITRDTGEFLSVLVRAMHAQRVLEIGTSNGYSTLWLADAASAIGGGVTTVEYSDFKVEMAARNFARSGIGHAITQIDSDAGKVLAATPDAGFDLIFLDSDRSAYPGWWPHIQRIIRPGGLLVVDNAASHPEQLAPFVELVKADPHFVSCLVPVGNGEFLATRSAT